jgi:hypothetical protein
VFFKIEAVHVIGTDKYDPDVIVADSGVALEDNLLRINKEDIAARIMEKYPYIASVEVHRKLPPSVEIIVTQSRPDGAIKKGDEVILFTKEGKVLERGTILIPETVPLVMGIEVDGPLEEEDEPATEAATDETEAETEGTDETEPVTDPPPGEIVRTEPGGFLWSSQSEKLAMFQNLLAAMEETGFTSITNVDLSDRLNIHIIYENRILLKLGVEADLPHKLQFVRQVLAENIGPEERGTLDVSEVSKWVIFSPEYGDSVTIDPEGETVGPPPEDEPYTEAEAETAPETEDDPDDETYSIKNEEDSV